MPLNINLPVDRVTTDVGHTDGHNTTNQAVNQIAVAVEESDSTHPPLSLPHVVINTASGVDPADTDTYLDATITISGEGAAPYSGATQVRGRGNYTWTLAKKPWRIKLATAASLLGMPAERDWVLLANHTDASKIRTAVAFEIGNRASGLDWTPRMRFVELTMNGTYRGLYQLGEHVEVGPNKINVTPATGTTGLELTGAYQMEIDVRYTDDGAPGFTTTQGVKIAYDNPDGTDATQAAYIADWVQEFEDALYDNTNWLDPALGYAKYIDRDSFIDWYIIEELCSNQDSGFGSSCKLYKTRDTAETPGKLYMGPLWDFDISLGNVVNEAHPATGYYTRTGAKWIDRMYSDPDWFAALIARWETLRSAIRTGDLIPAVIDRLTDRLHFATGRDQRRWVYTTDTADAADDMKEWLLTRIAWLNTKWVIDTEDPSVPTNLSATPGSSQVTLSWTASTDNVAVEYYRVFRDGAEVGTPAGTTYNATGLTNGVEYDFAVSAVDAAGNESAQTAPVTATPEASGPESVAGLVQWFKADAITGLSDGAAVASWPDSSGSGRHATQATSANQPIYKTSIVNGKPVVRFADSSDMLDVATAGTYTGTTMFAVVRSMATGDHSIRRHATNGGIEWRVTSGKIGLDKRGQANIVNGAIALSTTNFNVVALVNNETANEHRHYVNGTADNFLVGGENVGSDGAFTIGPPGATGNHDIAELIIYNTALSTGDRNLVTAYLGAKYGITVS